MCCNAASMVHQLAVMLLAHAVMLLAQYYRDSNSTDLPVFSKYSRFLELLKMMASVPFDVVN